MDFQIVWTEPATADLESIVTYIAQRNPLAAERTAEAIVTRIGLLTTVPFLGAVYRQGSRGPIREILSGNIRIFYRVLEEARRVEILTLWHGSRREPRSLE